MAGHPEEAQLINELTAIVRRAIALGKKQGSEETTSRILRAAAGEAAIPSEPTLPLRILPKPGSEPAKTRGPRKYPYGYVVSTVLRALSKYPEGLERAEIDRVCNEDLNADITADAVRSAVKQLVRTGKIERRGSKHFLKP